jgi:phospholipid/cholesterol/gamma-HCH transport system ATP-binding protein
MIQFRDVSIGSLRGVSFTLEAGLSCRILSESYFDKNALLEGMLGERRPEDGCIFVLGQAVSELQEAGRLALLRRIGFVPVRGGIVSNLKVWENILLPVGYHRGLRSAEVEPKVVQIYETLGFTGQSLDRYMSRPGGTLSVYEMRIVCLVRALLMEPEVMVYDSVLEGLSQDDASRLLELTEAFRAEHPGRLSIHLGADIQSLNGVRATRGLRQQGSEIVPWL